MITGRGVVGLVWYVTTVTLGVGRGSSGTRLNRVGNINEITFLHLLLMFVANSLDIQVIHMQTVCTYSQLTSKLLGPNIVKPINERKNKEKNNK